LFKTTISNVPFKAEVVEEAIKKIQTSLGITKEETSYFLKSEKLINNAYNENYKQINIKLRSGKILDLALASDNDNIIALSTPVEKFYLCQTKII
jgi:hypothetical protein